MKAEAEGRRLPRLELIGNVSREVSAAVAATSTITLRPFLDDSLLQETYRSSRALILSSEIEGFGLPALEAYYLGSPVCFVNGTSVSEILGSAASKGGFDLGADDSFFHALDEVLEMEPEEVRKRGLALRETFTSRSVAESILSVFERIRRTEPRD